MRTIVEIPDDIFKKAQVVANEQGMEINDLLNAGLGLILENHLQKKGDSQPFFIPAHQNDPVLTTARLKEIMAAEEEEEAAKYARHFRR